MATAVPRLLVRKLSHWSASQSQRITIEINVLLPFEKMNFVK